MALFLRQDLIILFSIDRCCSALGLGDDGVGGKNLRNRKKTGQKLMFKSLGDSFSFLIITFSTSQSL
jgi:hypothetical protein